MQKLFVGYLDGSAGAFTVPDDFAIYPGTTSEAIAELKIKDEATGLQVWILRSAVRSLVLMSAATEEALLGGPGVVSQAAQPEVEPEPLTLRTTDLEYPTRAELEETPGADVAAAIERLREANNRVADYAKGDFNRDQPGPLPTPDEK